MKEDFLHLLWQQQLHDRTQSRLFSGEPLTVLKPGIRNRNSGPDFQQARILIDELEWNGSVEIHVRASEWNQHGHQNDTAYQNVVLHVVWERDADVLRPDQTIVPVFELKDKIPLEVLLRYRELMENGNRARIPCEAVFTRSEPLRRTLMLERVLMERLERKAREIQQRYLANGKDWPNTFYQSLAYGLGLKANAEPMLILAQNLPMFIPTSLNWKPERIFPTLLGMGGFLKPGESKEIPDPWLQEFDHLQRKFQIQPQALQWKKFRVRPGAFPLQLLAAYARMMPAIPVWFREIWTGKFSPQAFQWHLAETEAPESMNQFLLDNGSFEAPLQLSNTRKEILTINVLAPFLVAIAWHLESHSHLELALDWLQQLPAERNTHIDFWKQLGQEAKTASDSQALLELHHAYCEKRRCMECQIGNALLLEKKPAENPEKSSVT